MKRALFLVLLLSFGLAFAEPDRWVLFSQNAYYDKESLEKYDGDYPSYKTGWKGWVKVGDEKPQYLYITCKDKTFGTEPYAVYAHIVPDSTIEAFHKAVCRKK